MVEDKSILVLPVIVPLLSVAIREIKTNELTVDEKSAAFSQIK